ncbi:MAG: trypsin-like peptidase domain-containing protein [Acidimicrobiia bacterium]
MDQPDEPTGSRPGWWHLPPTPPTTPVPPTFPSADGTPPPPPPSATYVPYAPYGAVNASPAGPSSTPDVPAAKPRRARSVLALVAACVLAFAATAFGFSFVGSHDNHGAKTAASAPSSAVIQTPADEPAPVPTTTPSAPAQSPATRTPSTPSTPTPATPNSGGSSSRASTASKDSDLVSGVVNITTVLGYQNGQAAGTGVILTADGEVLTNNHVISGATSINVEVISTGKTYKATVIGTSPSEDVALIKLQGASGLTPANIGSSNNLTPGQTVTAVGNAGGTGSPTVTTGQIVALGQTITASDDNGTNAETLENLIEINALLIPGDSGGPLYDSAGKVIGINTAASSGGFRSRRGGVTGSTDGYAIRIDDALSIVKQIRNGKATDTITIGNPAFLGIGSNASLKGNGVTITSLASDAPAAKAGLKVGDVITSVDGKALSGTESLVTVLKAHRPGDKVTIEWTTSSGSTEKATVELAAGPAN